MASLLPGGVSTAASGCRRAGRQGAAPWRRQPDAPDGSRAADQADEQGQLIAAGAVERPPTEPGAEGGAERDPRRMHAEQRAVGMGAFRWQQPAAWSSTR